MFRRIISLPNKQSFFLFGARGTGKTTLIESKYKNQKNTVYINLLDPDVEDEFIRNPNKLKEILVEQSNLSTVIVDEIQKAPRLLDVVHYLIEKYKNTQFVLTGSSARKLKHGGANLLAGRAASFFLHPMTFLEYPENFSLLEILSWGSLPKIFEFNEAIDKKRFLRSYVQTYLKQEIQLEQLVRNITSFREFLDLAAQSNTEVVNYLNIANKSGVDEKTIARYYEILVDTLVGFFLEPYSDSVRVRQSQKPKFYLLDTGISRLMSQSIDSEVIKGSSEYGKLFEQMIICECFRLKDYYEKDYRFSYLRTKDGAEIDLIVTKNRNKKILIEIKSTNRVLESDCRHLVSLGSGISNSEKWILCTETIARKFENGVRVLPWKQGIKELFDQK